MERLGSRLASEAKERKTIMAQLQEVRDDSNVILKKMADLQRTVFGLSTSALALSVTFSSSLIPDEPNDLYLLRQAWILFTISVIAFPLDALTDVAAKIGLPPFVLFKTLGVVFSAVGFACFIGGVLDFLRFALANLPAA